MAAHKGFTLIELMVVIAIIAIMAAVGFVSFTNAQIAGRDSRRKSDIRAIQVALELYYQVNRRYPTSNSAGTWEKSTDTTAPAFWLVDWGPNGDKGIGAVTFNNTYINAMPYDPTNSSTLLYQYYSAATFAPGTCLATQYYILTANLENAKDSEANSKKQYTFCGQAANTGNGVANNAFLVTPQP